MNNELSAMYWAEVDEMEQGIHPSQIIERFENVLKENGVQYDKITYLDYIENNLVRVQLDGVYYGTFDYIQNVFID